MGKYKFGPILDKKLEETNALLSFKQFPIMDKEMLVYLRVMKSNCSMLSFHDGVKYVFFFKIVPKGFISQPYPILSFQE
jgi:hypothetical protein